MSRQPTNVLTDKEIQFKQKQLYYQSEIKKISKYRKKKQEQKLNEQKETIHSLLQKVAVTPDVAGEGILKDAQPKTFQIYSFFFTLSHDSSR